VSLTQEQFEEEMAKRREKNPGKDVILGCPLCNVSKPPVKKTNTNTQEPQR
jgi:hypothetical protein